MQAITTYYLPAGNVRGARIVAKAARRIILPWDHSKDAEENHKDAAHEYARRLGWLERSDLVSGGNEDGSQVHVLVPKSHAAALALVEQIARLTDPTDADNDDNFSTLYRLIEDARKIMGAPSLIETEEAV